jgi:Nif-specific regulatory protein
MTNDDSSAVSAVWAPRDRAALVSERDFYRRLLELGGQDELEPLLERALQLIVEVTGAEVAYLELRDPGDDEPAALPRFWKGHGVSADSVHQIRSSISSGIIARTLLEGRTMMTPSAFDDDRFLDLGSVRHHEIRAVLCAPVGSHPPVGVVYLQGIERSDGFSAEDRDRAEIFARQLAPLADRLLARAPVGGRADHTQAIRARFACDELVGRSIALARVLQQAALVAPLDIDVLISGPAGTGKTALAKAIVNNSRRNRAPFIAVNCAAIPDTLIESELFGAERGAHSTATKRKPGLVAAAEGGTLFLDEVGELSSSAQAKLLQLLQEREYRPLGAGEAVRADVRVVSATNAELKQRVAERRFREDLYYRLHVMPVAMPSLSERREDIPDLVEHVCAAACRRHRFDAMTVTRRALIACREATWPGHVRELAHAIEAAVIRAHGEGASSVQPHHVFPDQAKNASEVRSPAGFHDATRQFHRRFLLEALEKNEWNVVKTGETIELSRAQLYNLINSLGIRENA